MEGPAKCYKRKSKKASWRVWLLRRSCTRVLTKETAREKGISESRNSLPRAREQAGQEHIGGMFISCLLDVSLCS